MRNSLLAGQVHVPKTLNNRVHNCGFMLLNYYRNHIKIGVIVWEIVIVNILEYMRT